jgi:phospholipid/cholesterol/gamma-HCH transport system substrate-binding protein
MIRLRHADEWVGLVVVVTVILFLGVTFQAGVLRNWFRPVSTLRMVLPEAGVAGLSEGAEVQVLGTRAGTVRHIVISPNQQMYAEVEIDDQARAFIRRDSQAVIRKSFGVAGAAFVDITRGSGAALDWRYAVIQATTERDPTESIGALIDQVREKVFPILDDAGRVTRALADMVEHINKGEGNIGVLLKDETLAQNAEETAARARAAMAQLDAVMRDIAAIVTAANTSDSSVPALLKRTDQTLASLQAAMKDLSSGAERVPQIARNVEGGTENLGSVLVQTQQTAHELELLLTQLRGLWLLGGNGTPPAKPVRLPSTQVNP